MKEIWKDILGFENYYQISNNGRVRSLDRVIIRSNGRICKRKGLILRTTTDRGGYKRASLIKDGKLCFYSVHRLVAKHFIKNPDNKPQVNHIDSNRANNFYKNLAWCTASENNFHAYKFGNHFPVKGEKNGKAKLSEKDVIFIRENFNSGLYSRVYLSKKYKVGWCCIDDIIKNKKWKHINVKTKPNE